jgi:hypothetical protein
MAAAGLARGGPGSSTWQAGRAAGEPRGRMRGAGEVVSK